MPRKDGPGKATWGWRPTEGATRTDAPRKTTYEGRAKKDDLALSCIFYLVWKHPLADLIANTIAPIGLIFSILTLITGSLWGKPMWGTWWVWDARLTSMLILFFFYLGFILLSNAFERKIDGSKTASVLAIIGLINLPIIKFSVDWWHTLHQPSSILRMDGPSIDKEMLFPLSLMMVGFSLFSLYLIIINVKTMLMEKKM